MELQTQQSFINAEAQDDELEALEKKRKLHGSFAEKVELYDPLDRPLPSEEEQQSVTTQELLGKIMELKPIDGRLLNAPIPSKHLSFLDQMFRFSFEECEKIAEKYI